MFFNSLSDNIRSRTMTMILVFICVLVICQLT